MNQKFPKCSRLRKSREFLFIQRQGKKVHGNHVQFLVHRSAYKSEVRLGLTVSAKYGDSVERNLFKRRHREIYRRLKETIPSGWMIHIRPFGKVKHAREVASYEALARDWEKLLVQINIWNQALQSSEDAGDGGH